LAHAAESPTKTHNQVSPKAAPSPPQGWYVFMHGAAELGNALTAEVFLRLS